MENGLNKGVKRATTIASSVLMKAEAELLPTLKHFRYHYVYCRVRCFMEKLYKISHKACLTVRLLCFCCHLITKYAFTTFICDKNIPIKLAGQNGSECRAVLEYSSR